MSIFFVFDDQDRIIAYFDDINDVIEFCDKEDTDHHYLRFVELLIKDKKSLQSFIISIQNFAYNWNLK